MEELRKALALQELEKARQLVREKWHGTEFRLCIRLCIHVHVHVYTCI